MATIEKNAVFAKKDDAGNLNLFYPATKKENVLDLSVATTTESGLMSASDKQKLDGITPQEFAFGIDETGPYIMQMQ